MLFGGLQDEEEGQETDGYSESRLAHERTGRDVDVDDLEA